jgi:hypothetical protein
MRFTFVSVERFGEAVADGSTRLWLDQGVIGGDTRSAYPYLTQMAREEVGTMIFVGRGIRDLNRWNIHPT